MNQEFSIAEAVSVYGIGDLYQQLRQLMLGFGSVETANEELHNLTGIRTFFHDAEALQTFHKALILSPHDQSAVKMEQWGDFQTPPGLAERICRYLTDSGFSPDVIIEPTYGTGNFILAAMRHFNARMIYGVEIQKIYQWPVKIAILKEALNNVRKWGEIELVINDIFSHSFPESVLNADNILILGNPPWITSAELGSLEAANLPIKRNVMALSGLDALTGKSNFDIGEFIIRRLLEVFHQRSGILAMLCKNAVIRNIVAALPRTRFIISDIKALGIDAAREFGVAVEASLLVIRLGASNPQQTCEVASFDQPGYVSRVFGWIGNHFVSDIELYKDFAEFDGHSPLVWRQGIKHDCSNVMEIKIYNGQWINGLGELVDVEEGSIYWLLKSSDLRQFEVKQARRKVIITQRQLGEDTKHLKINAPKLWDYLARHKNLLDKRKSSIYQGRPSFAMFGVGDYSFKLYKVAISGLYKEPVFSLVLPIDNEPVILDDTCYFLSFDNYTDALFTATLLNSIQVKGLLPTITFSDAKRPYTKESLMRIDLNRVASSLSFADIQTFWQSINYSPEVCISELEFEQYRQWLAIINGKDEKLLLPLE